MAVVAFCYLMGLILIGNSAEVKTPFLVAADSLLAIIYIVAGSVAGWQNARNDEN